MVTVIIKDDGEKTVTQMTYTDLWHQLKDIPDAELLVSDDWFECLPKIKNNYVCFVEADCVISDRYFEKQIKEMRKNPGRKISMLTAKTGVQHWENCFYGYCVDLAFKDGTLDKFVLPIKKNKSSSPYPVQIGYLPGAIIRTSMLRDAIANLGVNARWSNDFVFLSTELSLAFWRQGANGEEKKIQNGNPVYVNPSVEYVTTEGYVNDVGNFDFNANDLINKFTRESI